MAQSVFEHLQEVGRLPTPPKVVLRLLELTRQDDVSIKQVADTIAMDPVMAAKIIRFVNSPMAGVVGKIARLDRAVALVGMNGVKMMALSYTVLSSSAAEVCRGFDVRQFCMHSVGCGVACRILSTVVPGDADVDSFLAGLLSQIGRSVFAIGFPDRYTEVLDVAKQIPGDLPELEQRAFGESYPAVSAQLLRSWHIPEEICSAIEGFRSGDDHEGTPALIRALRVGEIAASIICPNSHGSAPDSATFIQMAKRLLAIEPEQSLDLLTRIAKEIEDMRDVLELPKGRLRSPDVVELEVRERIAELTLAISIENKKMAQERQELMHKAITDALTGVGNRAAFDARLSLETQRAARSKTSLALMFIDVDQFKLFNDTHGHLAGDHVLQSLARVLEGCLRKVDYIARYGGEEFAVIAPDTARDGARILAERLRRTAENMRVEWEGRPLNVTISVGVSVFTALNNDDETSKLIRVADAQLYAAKNAGRNRVKMVVDGITTVPII